MLCPVVMGAMGGQSPCLRHLRSLRHVWLAAAVHIAGSSGFDAFASNLVYPFGVTYLGVRVTRAAVGWPAVFVRCPDSRAWLVCHRATGHQKGESPQLQPIRGGNL